MHHGAGSHGIVSPTIQPYEINTDQSVRWTSLYLRLDFGPMKDLRSKSIAFFNIFFSDQAYCQSAFEHVRHSLPIFCSFLGEIVCYTQEFYTECVSCTGRW